MLEGVTMNTMWMAHKTKSYSKKQRDSPQNGSPTHFMQDEYDFPEDKMSDDGDDRFLDDHDETDEGLCCLFAVFPIILTLYSADTEEASETDMGKTEEYTEIKEQ
jgi:hypothetical protein